MGRRKQHIHTIAETYDEDAEAAGWFGPEVAFGLTYKDIQPNQSLLDIGIMFLKACLMHVKARDLLTWNCTI